ncbi:MAG: glycosyltransferase [Blastocatellales bacterium]
MSKDHYLAQVERLRDDAWHPGAGDLRRRAMMVRNCLHVLPGERVLEFGAGIGMWTGHLTGALRAESPITSAVFNSRLLPGGSDAHRDDFLLVTDPATDLPEEHFDHVVGNGMLDQEMYSETLSMLNRVLKPGGRILMFENRLSAAFRENLVEAAHRTGFTGIRVFPFSDAVHGTSAGASTFLLEHAPFVNRLCNATCVCMTKDGIKPAENVSLAVHERLFDSVSVVVPCRNEEMNIQPLTEALLRMYSGYIREIIIVNDNSTDGTGRVAAMLAERDRRIRVIDRLPPGGVGRALRDGTGAATGSYILTMDCDFVVIVSELRDLFEAVAAGRDGAVGSRFSSETVMFDYPFLKILCNRGFHLLINLLLPVKVRDVTNNLKLYRAEIFRGLEIAEDHFAANLETGLKPILSGYDIEEVPVSWINRTAGMGSSSFNLMRVGPGYVRALARIVIDRLLGEKRPVRGADQ